MLTSCSGSFANEVNSVHSCSTGAGADAGAAAAGLELGLVADLECESAVACCQHQPGTATVDQCVGAAAGHQTLVFCWQKKSVINSTQLMQTSSVAPSGANSSQQCHTQQMLAKNQETQMQHMDTLNSDTDHSIAEKIRQRLQQAGQPFLANHNISQFIEPGELPQLQAEVAAQLHQVLRALVIDTEQDHNTQDTANRVAKMFVQEIFSGRYEPAPRVTSFPNVTQYDQLYAVGPISVRSTCAHHLMPIQGRAYIGIFPGVNVIGLSKFNRITDWIASRPQIQEELTVQIADAVEQATDAAGVAVLVQAEHFCMTHRGVRAHESDMTTSVLRGVLRTDHNLRQEFFNIVQRMK